MTEPHPPLSSRPTPAERSESRGRAGTHLSARWDGWVPGLPRFARSPRTTGREGFACILIVLPYLWLAAFFLAPFLIVLKISLSQTALAQPPYTPLFDLAAGWQGIRDFAAGLSLDAYALLFSDWLYLLSYLRSLAIGIGATVIMLLLGFPIAYALARAPKSAQGILLVLIVLPFWTSFLIRIYAWMNILQRDGLLNGLLQVLGIIDAPAAWLATDTPIIIGIVYSYLPFMVLPLYASLQKMDATLLEAAADLGAPAWKAFWQVTVPLARPGIAAGSLLCFIPIVGEFVIPDLLGGSQSLMIGQTLWLEFFSNKDWPVASALAVVLLLVLIVPIVFYQRQQMRALEAGR
jgi:putrescine transport system permease protein